jgi:hypothetical protein
MLVPAEVTFRDPGGATRTSLGTAMLPYEHESLPSLEKR